jgi:hypothetical protein
VVVEFFTSTLSLLGGVIKRFYFWLPTFLLDPFDLAERYLRVSYFPPAFMAWGLFGLGLFLAVAETYREIWQKQTIHILTRAKAQFREHADKGHQIFDASEGIFKIPEGMFTGEIVDDWVREGYAIVKNYLGVPQANTFQRIIDNQLASASPNEVPKEGHAINAGIGWLEARAHEITKYDLKR